jgi:lipopolysaccharide/colanic/teichoic acid biosynthesis glycosyltransferase/SAM-dependent methyltransferase
MRNKLYILRPISIILIVTLLWQSVSWANPEIFRKKSASDTLQVPSFFSFSQKENVLRAALISLVNYFGDALKEKEFNYRLKPTIAGEIVDMDFGRKYRETASGEKDEKGENLIVPCTLNHGRLYRLYEAVITPDEEVSLRKPGEKPKPTALETTQEPTPADPPAVEPTPAKPREPQVPAPAELTSSEEAPSLQNWLNENGISEKQIRKFTSWYIRLFDIIAAIPLTIVAVFVIAIFAIPILLTKGPLFYRGRENVRVGYKGKPITILKLRTMVDQKETRIGKFLRKSRLDELPQAFNILQGTMSIFGPRPRIRQSGFREDIDEEYENTIMQIRKPGLFDLYTAKVGGGKGSTKRDLEEIKKLGLYEIKNFSLRLALKILWLNACNILSDMFKLCKAIISYKKKSPKDTQGYKESLRTEFKNLLLRWKLIVGLLGLCAVIVNIMNLWELIKSLSPLRQGLLALIPIGLVVFLLLKKKIPIIKLFVTFDDKDKPKSGETPETKITIYDFCKFLRTKCSARALSPEDIAEEFKKHEGRAISPETVKKHLKILVQLEFVIEWPDVKGNINYMIPNRDQAGWELADPILQALGTQPSIKDIKSAEEKLNNIWYTRRAYIDWYNLKAPPYTVEDVSILEQDSDLRHRLAEEIGKEHKGKSLLSVGVGLGSLEKDLIDKWELDVTGVDILEEYLDIAKDKGIKTRLASGEYLPFDNNTFDIVLISQTIGHMDLERALREAHRVLRPGGFIHIITHKPKVHLEESLRYRQDDAKTILSSMRKVGFWNIVSLEFHEEYIHLRAKKDKKDKPHGRGTRQKPRPPRGLTRVQTIMHLVIATLVMIFVSRHLEWITAIDALRNMNPVFCFILMLYYLWIMKWVIKMIIAPESEADTKDSQSETAAHIPASLQFIWKRLPRGEHAPYAHGPFFEGLFKVGVPYYFCILKADIGLGGPNIFLFAITLFLSACIYVYAHILNEPDMGMSTSFRDIKKRFSVPIEVTRHGALFALGIVVLAKFILLQFPIRIRWLLGIIAIAVSAIWQREANLKVRDKNKLLRKEYKKLEKDALKTVGNEGEAGDKEEGQADEPSPQRLPDRQRGYATIGWPVGKQPGTTPPESTGSGKVKRLPNKTGNDSGSGIINLDTEGGQDKTQRRRMLSRVVTKGLKEKASIIKILTGILTYKDLYEEDLEYLANHPKNADIRHYGKIALAVHEIYGDNRLEMPDTGILTILEREKLATAIALASTGKVRNAAARILRISTMLIGKWIIDFDFWPLGNLTEPIGLSEQQRKELRRKSTEEEALDEREPSIEKEAYVEAVALVGLNYLKVKRILDVSHPTAYTKMKYYGFVLKTDREVAKERGDMLFEIIVAMYRKTQNKPVDIEEARCVLEKDYPEYESLKTVTLRRDVRVLIEQGRFSKYTKMQLLMPGKKRTIENASGAVKEPEAEVPVPRLADQLTLYMPPREMKGEVEAAIFAYKRRLLAGEKVNREEIDKVLHEMRLMGLHAEVEELTGMLNMFDSQHNNNDPGSDIIERDPLGGPHKGQRLEGFAYIITEGLKKKSSIIKILTEILTYPYWDRNDLELLAENGADADVKQYAKIALAVDEMYGKNKLELPKTKILPMLQRKKIAAAVALVYAGWHQGTAAEILGISIDAISKWIYKFELQPLKGKVKHIELTEQQRKELKLTNKIIEKEAYQEAMDFLGDNAIPTNVSRLLGKGETYPVAKRKMIEHGFKVEKTDKVAKERRERLLKIIGAMHKKSPRKPVNIAEAGRRLEKKYKEYAPYKESVPHGDVKALREQGRFKGMQVGIPGRGKKIEGKEKKVEKKKVAKKVQAPAPRLADQFERETPIEVMIEIIDEAILEYKRNLVGVEPLVAAGSELTGDEIYEAIKKLKWLGATTKARELKELLDNAISVLGGKDNAVRAVIANLIPEEPEYSEYSWLNWIPRLLFAGGILPHELTHYLYARAKGIKLEKVHLLSEVKPAEEQPRGPPGAWFYLSGPFANLIVAIISEILFKFLLGDVPFLTFFFEYLVYTNTIVFITELICSRFDIKKGDFYKAKTGNRPATTPPAPKGSGKVKRPLTEEVLSKDLPPITYTGEDEKGSHLRVACVQIKEGDFIENTNRMATVVSELKDKLGKNAPSLVIFPENLDAVRTTTYSDSEMHNRRKIALQDIATKTGIYIGYSSNQLFENYQDGEIFSMFYYIVKPNERYGNTIPYKFRKYSHNVEQRVFSIAGYKIGILICMEAEKVAENRENSIKCSKNIKEAKPDLLLMPSEINARDGVNIARKLYNNPKKNNLKIPVAFINLLTKSGGRSCFIPSRDLGDIVTLSDKEGILMVDVPHAPTKKTAPKEVRRPPPGEEASEFGKGSGGMSAQQLLIAAEDLYKKGDFAAAKAMVMKAIEQGGASDSRTQTLFSLIKDKEIQAEDRFRGRIRTQGESRKRRQRIYGQQKDRTSDGDNMGSQRLIKKKRHWSMARQYFDKRQGQRWQKEWQIGDNELKQKEKEVIALRLKRGLKSRLGGMKEETPRLLDIGGSSERITHELAPLFSKVVIIEQNPHRIHKICEANEDIPNLMVVQGDFHRHGPKERFSVALCSHVFFLMPRDERNGFLYDTIEVVKPGGWIAIVLNSMETRPGNHVHFREFMGSRKITIKRSDTVEQVLKNWGCQVEVEKVEISHQRHSAEEMAELIAVALKAEDRERKSKILRYVNDNLKTPDGYEFYSDQEILWVKIPAETDDYDPNKDVFGGQEPGQRRELLKKAALLSRGEEKKPSSNENDSEEARGPPPGEAEGLQGGNEASWDALKRKGHQIYQYFRMRKDSKEGILLPNLTTEGRAFDNSSEKVLSQIAECFLKTRPNARVLDCGSGINTALAYFSLFASHVKGIEVVKKLFNFGNDALDGLGENIDRSKSGNYFDENFSEFDLIYIYWPYADLPLEEEEERAAQRLEDKLLQQMKPDAVFVFASCTTIKPTFFNRLEKIEHPSFSEKLDNIRTRAYRIPQGRYDANDLESSDRKDIIDEAQAILQAEGAAEDFQSNEKTTLLLKANPPPLVSPVIKQPFLRNLTDREELSKNMIEAVLSILLSGKKLVLAFDNGIGGLQSSSPLGVFRSLKRLKRDPNFEKLLKNLIIIEAPAEAIDKKIQPYSEENTEVFVYARKSEKETLQKLEDKTRINLSYINEKGFTTDAWYPLTEIVTLTLIKYLNNYNIDELLARIDESSMKLEQLNIESIAGKEGFLIFNLLPDAEAYDTQDLIKENARLKRLVRDA